MTGAVKSRESHRNIVDTVNFECVIEECEDVCCVSKHIPITDVDLKRLEGVEGNLLNFIMIKEEIEGVPTLYGNKKSGALSLRRKHDKCVFLEDSRCNIYQSRPMACRMYPLNPILTIRGGLPSLRVTIDRNCSGVGCGDPIDMEEIKQLIGQWVKERAAYEKKVYRWNQRKDRDIAKFIRRCLK